MDKFENLNNIFIDVFSEIDNNNRHYIFRKLGFNVAMYVDINLCNNGRIEYLDNLTRTCCRRLKSEIHFMNYPKYTQS